MLRPRNCKLTLIDRYIQTLRQLANKIQNNVSSYRDLELVFATQSAFELKWEITICQTDLCLAHFG